jgi:hypothetical protein
MSAAQHPQTGRGLSNYLQGQLNLTYAGVNTASHLHLHCQPLEQLVRLLPHGADGWSLMAVAVGFLFQSRNIFFDMFE